MIEDSYGRTINYLRIAVTDRCNLRCTYCMPAEGLDWLPHKNLMTFEEMFRCCSLLLKMGVEKIRITGGEPFLRKDLVPFLYRLSEREELKELTLTTNGLLTEKFIPDLKKMGIKSVNISLDTLDANRFKQITHRDGLDKVLSTMYGLLENDIDVKINAVVMEDKNIEDIIPLIKLTEKLPIAIRFIEEMPFNGGGHTVSLKWDFAKILQHIQSHFSGIIKVTDQANSTSYNYKIPGYKGNVGIIAAYTRSFCGSCNRIRITPEGVIRTCLYDAGTLNLKNIMRNGSTDEELKSLIENEISKKAKDGWAAQNILVAQQKQHESMATIGG